MTDTAPTEREPRTPLAPQGSSVYLVVRAGTDGVMAVYNNKDDAYEDLDIRTGRGSRPDLDGRYTVEGWHVSGVAAGAATETGGLPSEIQHALDAINAALDKASYGDSVEGDLLEAHATLDSLVSRLRSPSVGEDTPE